MPRSKADSQAEMRAPLVVRQRPALGDGRCALHIRQVETPDDITTQLVAGADAGAGQAEVAWLIDGLVQVAAAGDVVKPQQAQTAGPAGKRSKTRASPTVEKTRFLWPMSPTVPSK